MILYGTKSTQEESPSLETARSSSESAFTIVKPAWEHPNTKERWNLSFRWNAPSSGQRGIMISLSKIFQLIATKILYQIYNTIWESKILTLFCFPYFSFANCLESDQGPHQYLQYLRLHHRHNQCHQLLISEITNICPLGNHTGVWLWFNISVNHCH